MLQKQSAGARMLTKHLEKEDVIKKEGMHIPDFNHIQDGKAKVLTPLKDSMFKFF